MCGPIEVDPESSVTATNPRLIVEVLRDGTEQYDRGAKLAHYQQIPSLAVVVLVTTRERRIEVHRRGPNDAWSTSTHGPGDAAAIAELDCRLVVDDIYRVVDER